MEGRRKIWNKFIAKHIGVLPKQIWPDISWRGKKIGSFLNEDNFKFETTAVLDTQKFSKNIRNLVREHKAYRQKCIKANRPK
jgi:hypothetical protein